MSESLEHRLKGYIESVKNTVLEIPAEDLAKQNLTADLALDSLDVMNLLFHIEESEEVSITETDLESQKIGTLGGLADYIRALQT